MELNTSGYHKIFPEMNPGSRILALMKERGIPVVLGSDSHQPERVAEKFKDALDILETVGYDTVSSFANRQRQEIKISDAKSRLVDEPRA